MKLVQIDVFGKRGLLFEPFNGWEAFNSISQIIEDDLEGETIQFLTEGYFGVKWYVIRNILLELIYDEDIGIYLKNVDKNEFIEGYIDGNIEDGFKILSELNFDDNKFAFLRKIAEDISL